MNRQLSFAGATFTTIIWGLSYVSTKFLVGMIPPEVLILYRFAISAVVLFTLLKITDQNSKLEFCDLPKLFTSAFVGYTMYFLCESNGIKLTSASVASIIIGMIPVLSLLTDVVFFKNKLTGMRLFSVLLSFLGVILVIGVKSDASSTSGILLIFGAVVCWILFNYLTQPLYKKYSSLAISSYQSMIAFLTMLPIVLFSHGDKIFTIYPGTLGHILFLGLFSSAAGFLMYIYALKNLGVLTTTLFVNFIPVTTMLTGRFFLNERLTLLQYAGGIVIVISLYVSTFFSSKSEVLETN
ncbi:MAG: DMT family transporter [Eubacteriaceae bacterium]|nr:DMT family transporter [Eubacteriaceae bacterium]